MKMKKYLFSGLCLLALAPNLAYSQKADPQAPSVRIAEELGQLHPAVRDLTLANLLVGINKSEKGIIVLCGSKGQFDTATGGRQYLYEAQNIAHTGYMHFDLEHMYGIGGSKQYLCLEAIEKSLKYISVLNINKNIAPAMIIVLASSLNSRPVQYIGVVRSLPAFALNVHEFSEAQIRWALTAEIGPLSTTRNAELENYILTHLRKVGRQ